jgi:sulfite reductase (NADPH) hemoprotein beta-component
MAAAPKRPPLPAILLANDLLDGDVVFAAMDGDEIVWTRDPSAARIAHDEAVALSLEDFAAAELAGNRVVDAYLVDVAIENGRPVPRHFREKFKTLGPSNRPDLGKQAGEGLSRTA